MDNELEIAIVDFFKKNHDSAHLIDWDIPITVCKSAAGYYLGQVDPEDGTPLCRLSTEYWNTRKEAQTALDNGAFGAKLWL